MTRTEALHATPLVLHTRSAGDDWVTIQCPLLSIRVLFCPPKRRALAGANRRGLLQFNVLRSWRRFGSSKFRDRPVQPLLHLSGSDSITTHETLGKSAKSYPATWPGNHTYL